MTEDQKLQEIVDSLDPPELVAARTYELRAQWRGLEQMEKDFGTQPLCTPENWRIYRYGSEEERLAFENSVLIANARPICRERITDNLFCMQTGSGTTGWIRRTFFALQGAIGPNRLAEIYEQEMQKYSMEVNPEVWRIFTTGTDAEIEALQERANAESGVQS